VSEREVGWLYPAARAVLTPVFRFSWQLHVEGLEHVPTSGGALICPNHTSVLDSFFIPLALPRRITYVGKAEYLDDWKTKYLFPAMGMIPIDRSGGSSSERALAAAQRIIEGGGLFGIYPEGTRSRDGHLYRGHTGPARLALRTGAPLVPVGIRGSREIWPPQSRRPNPWRPVSISFGRPIETTRYAGGADDRMLLRQITDELMFEIRELSGQTYVDEYATKKKRSAPESAERAETETETVTGPEPVGVGARGNGERTGNGRGEARPVSLREYADLDDPIAPRSSADVLRRESA
jgi:1-acyl-sn-glycerol-3-phosphate acyltransferase